MSRQGIDSGEKNELRTAAILVWHHQRIGDGRKAWVAMLETNADQWRRVEQFRAELHRVVGAREDISFRINGGCVEAEVENLRFAALETTSPQTQQHQTLITLLGRCPSCGVETPSVPLHSFSMLGRLLDRFEPHHQHSCYGSKIR